MICLAIAAFLFGEAVSCIKIDKDKWIKRFFRISTVFVFFSLMSCTPDAKPIEKYKGWVLVKKGIPYPLQKPYEDIILIKNKDSIKKVNVLLFDIQNLKPGDTIK